jgi:membrane-associated protease RseP (regulator of RpoE activity)
VKKALIIAILALPMLVLAEGKMGGYLGVYTEELSDATRTALNVKSGILVSKVQEDSPAEKAGLMTGDIIMELDGVKVESYKDLKTAISERPNKKVKIVFMRSGKKMDKTAELGEMEMKKKKIIDIESMDLDEIKGMCKEMCKDIEGMEGMKKIKIHMDDTIDDLKKEVEMLKKEVEELKKKIK